MLLPGKENMGKNIATEMASGKSHDQAVAIAMDFYKKNSKSKPTSKKKVCADCLKKGEKTCTHC